eukprot:scaffold1522_cov340-Prasinococcus_capsulatus_cf.AAC.7
MAVSRGPAQGHVFTSAHVKSARTRRQTLNYGQTVSNRDLFGKVTGCIPPVAAAAMLSADDTAEILVAGSRGLQLLQGVSGLPEAHR